MNWASEIMHPLTVGYSSQCLQTNGMWTDWPQWHKSSKGIKNISPFLLSFLPCSFTVVCLNSFSSLREKMYHFHIQRKKLENRKKAILAWSVTVIGNAGEIIQSLSRVRLSSTPWTAAHQASLSITNFQTLLKLMSTESVMPYEYKIPDRCISTMCSTTGKNSSCKVSVDWPPLRRYLEKESNKTISLFLDAANSIFYRCYLVIDHELSYKFGNESSYVTIFLC